MIENKSYDEIINLFSEAFLQTTFSLAADIEKASEEIKQFVAEKTAELDIKDAEDVAKITRESHSTATANVDAALKASEAYKEREALLERLARLDKVLTNKKVLLNKKEDVAVKEKAKKKAEETLQSKKLTLSMQLNKKLLDYPKAIRTRIVN
jgi:hypothetical protein